ncbi:MAG: hypothetical protein PHP70_09745 [Gallionella sp.]|nr:hypothetical protein [Gallionella sp.]
MLGKIAIRNIPAAIWEGLETLAHQHERSLEGEARYALQSWVEPLIQQKERSARRIEVSARLRDLLEQTNKTVRGRPIKPSHIAQEIGEDYAEGVENWFSGEQEPSFKQLDAIATYLGGESVWLRHGDRQMFPIESTRIPESPAEGFEWLLDLAEPEKVSYLHLVRNSNERGSLAIVKQYGDLRCKTYITPYHVSEVIGTGGESSLAHLSVILELLYKYYTTKGGTKVTVKSYLLSEGKFRALLEGQTHPLSLLREISDTPWWEDFWDVNQFRQHEYWLGWKSVCERIYRIVESTSYYQEQLKLIRSQTHPCFERVANGAASQ